MSQDRKSILVTNDDGIDSPGIQALAKAVEPLGDVYVVAPAVEMSGMSHALALDKPLECRWINEKTVALNSTPVACVKFAFHEWFIRSKPALVVSGINHGANLGNDVNYSGTVAAALEGAFQGVPALAVSLVNRYAPAFDRANGVIRRVAESLMRQALPGGSCLNMNIPDLPLEAMKGLKVTRQGRRIYFDEMVSEARDNGRGMVRMRVTREASWIPEEGSDMDAVAQGWISLTPLSLDFTHHEYLRELEERVEGWKNP